MATTWSRSSDRPLDPLTPLGVSSQGKEVVVIAIVGGGLIVVVVALALLLRSFTKPEPVYHERRTIDRFFS
jgi:hypothetical protein